MKIGQEIVSQAVLDVVRDLGILKVHLEFAYLRVKPHYSLSRLQTVTNICDIKHH